MITINGPRSLTSPILVSRLETKHIVKNCSSQAQPFLMALATNNSPGRQWSVKLEVEKENFCRLSMATHKQAGAHTYKRGGKKVYLSMLVVRRRRATTWGQTRYTHMQRHTRTHIISFPGDHVSILFNYWASHLLIMFQSSMKPSQLVPAQHPHYAYQVRIRRWERFHNLNIDNGGNDDNEGDDSKGPILWYVLPFSKLAL